MEGKKANPKAHYQAGHHCGHLELDPAERPLRVVWIVPWNCQNYLTQRRRQLILWLYSSVVKGCPSKCQLSHIPQFAPVPEQLDGGGREALCKKQDALEARPWQSMFGCGSRGWTIKKCAKRYEGVKDVINTRFSYCANQTISPYCVALTNPRC